MDGTPQIGMDQLSYFVGILDHYLDPNWQERFWNRIRENCPDLMQAIGTSDPPFTGEWEKILFTRDLISPAFDPEIVFGGE